MHVISRGAAVWMALLVSAMGCDGAEARPADPTPKASAYGSPVVDAALDAATEVARTRGFTLESEAWRGFVVERGTEVTEVTLRTGSCYLILLAGSNALREASLRLFDSDGGEVARDAHPGPATALHHCPPQSGTYYLGVRATAGNGLFGVLRFRGPTGLDVRLDDFFPPSGSPSAPVGDPP